MMRFKTWSLTLLALGFAANTWATPVLVKQQQQVEEYKLENGFRVILAPNDKETKVYMNTVYMVGALDDPKGKGGLAHLLEHLAFKGTKNVPDEEFQRRLDQYTLMTNASTDYNSTRYISVLRPDAHALREMLYLEAERMQHLVLKEKFVPSEIEIVKREREVRLDQPFSVLMDQVWKAAYGNQYLGRLPIGDIDELKSIQLKELNQFYQQYYAPNNAVMIVSGKFDKADVLKTIDQHFSSIPSKTLPKRVEVPALDVSKIAQKQFEVRKGSDYAKFNLYLSPSNDVLKPALALSPLLYTLQPSGHLYQSAVESGLSTAVQSSTWLDQHFDLVFMGAIYAPTHDSQRLQQTLISTVEKGKTFDDSEIRRVKNLVKNAQEQLWTNASAVGQLLADYVVTYQGNWTRYFEQQAQLQNITANELNNNLRQVLNAQHRVTGHILPTPEDQKKAQAQAAEVTKTLDQQAEAPEPLKDVSVYQKEVEQYLQKSAIALAKAEKTVQRGQLKNGLKYALYPAQTPDGRTYATIDINFGDARSLMHKSEIIDLTSYLLLRGTQQYTLQAIADKSIELSASATASPSSNGMVIKINAKDEHFSEYFDFVIDLLKQPIFEQSQFDLIKTQSLASLDRPYTEPDVVAQLTLSRLLEQYQPGDLRYHFEPELSRKAYQAAKREDVVQLYKEFVAMNHAHVAITGPIDVKDTTKRLNKAFAKWNNKRPYQAVFNEYQATQAQKHHMLAEQREFGNYQSILTFPVSAYHPDAAALVVIGHILGDSQLSSRLGLALREKNALVYGFGSNVDLSSRTDSGVLGISANYTAGKSPQVSEVVRQVILRLREKGVTEQELAAAKADILKKRVTALEDERNIHKMLISQLEFNKAFKDREIRDQEYAQLTKTQVDEAIRKYLRLEGLVEVMADQYGQAQPIKP